MWKGVALRIMAERKNTALTPIYVHGQALFEEVRDDFAVTSEGGDLHHIAGQSRERLRIKDGDTAYIRRDDAFIS